jgi:Flp pilus assembly protein TadG
MMKTRTCRGSPRERGAITPILAVSLAMALGLMALTVDLGQLFVGKNELQNIADAAALAGAKKLIQEDPSNPGRAVVNCTEAITKAQAIAAENRSSGAAMTVTGADVVVGQWDHATGSFTRTGCSANPMEVTAIQVTVRRDGTDNPSLSTNFAGMVGGGSTMNTSATAVAYLGLAGTSSLSIPFGVPANYPAGQEPHNPYTRINPLLDWLLPRPAIAADQTYKWKDDGGATGGTTLDTTRAIFIMPLYGERTDLTKLQKYIKGQVGGGLRYPQVQTGQKVYPISEYRWTSNVYNNFNYMKNRFNAEKDPATGKWRVTVAVYGTTDPLAAAPTPNPWLKLAQRLLPGPTAAYACASYTSPAVWVQGFVTLDIKKVMCDYNGDGTWDSTCTSKAYPNDGSCYKKCYMEVEVPLNQNFVSYDQSAKPTPVERSYQDINPSASNVGNFASVPYLVK